MATGVTSSITSDISFTSHYQLTKDDDTLIISGATVTMLKPQGDIFTDAGNDTVRIEDSTIFTDQPNLSLSLGSGDDTLTVTNTTFSAPVWTGSGNDVVTIAGTAQNKVRLNQELTFGAGDDLLELISMLVNAGSIDFGSSGIKKLRFNGGALLPVQVSGTTNYGTIGSFTDLDVSIAGGTTGSNLRLSGEQTSITLNGNFVGTDKNRGISISGGTTTLIVGSNVRTNVRLVLNNAELIHADGAILEFSGYSGYAVTANESIVDLHDIVILGGNGLTGSNTHWSIENCDFSNASEGINLSRGTLKLQTVGIANYSTTAIVLSGTTLSGSKVSLMSNQGGGAMRITSGGIEISDFKVNKNTGTAISQNDGTMSLTSAVFSGNTASCNVSCYGSWYRAFISASYYYDIASGGAICQSGGSMIISSAVFSGNLATANTYSRSWGGPAPEGKTSYHAEHDGSAYGGAIYQDNGIMSLTNASFSGNTASAGTYGGGGAIFQNGGVMTLTSASFQGNGASSDGGAIYLSNTIANLEDTVFSENSAGYGGALHVNNTTLNYVVTSGSSVSNTGNSGRGGWLYVTENSTINITIRDKGLLTLGDSDSIAGKGSTDSRITKNGTGYMLVNSDISGFSGLWSVAAGTLELARIARTLKLDDWTIGTDATLILSVLNDKINMNTSKKVGTIDLGGGADTINTNGYDLTDGLVLLSDLTLTGGGRVSVKLRNRSTTEGSTLRLGGIYLDNEFTGNNYRDTILITAESTLNGAIDLGEGNNVVSATALAMFSSTFQAGAGNDTLRFATVTFEDVLDLGDGNNSVTAAGTAKFKKEVSTGSGNDTLSFTDVTMEDTLALGDGDNAVTITGTGKLQSIIGGSGNDTITLDTEGKISGVIDLGGGKNEIYVNQMLTADKVRITENGETTVYVFLGSTVTNNTLTVYSDESAARDTIMLNWGEQTDLDKVRILVSKDSSFQSYEFNLELYNKTKSFTLNLEQGYFIQFQANDEDGWEQRLLDDHVAPNQVSGVKFNGSSLSWDETHDNLGGNGVKQYHVEVSDNASFTNLIASEKVTGTQYTPEPMAEKMLYFRVKAEDYTGNIGTWSDTASGMVDNTPPSRPSGGKSTVDGYSVDLSWSASTDTGSGMAFYEYRIATDEDFEQIVAEGSTETCSISIDNLNYCGYNWQVRAVDVAGNTGEWSLNKSFSTVDTVAPATPGNLDYGIENGSTLSAIWDAVTDDQLGSGLNRYEVQLASDAEFSHIVKTLSATMPEITVQGLSSGEYYLRVCAVDNVGNVSDWTAAETFTIDADTTPPTISNIRASITQLTKQNVVVTASFADNVALAASQYKIGKKGEWKDYKNGVNVTENSTVYFKAVDISGNTSAEVSFVVSNIDNTPPTAPGGLQATVDEQKVTLSWTASIDTLAGMKEYVVKYSHDGQEFTATVNGTNYVLTGLASGSWNWSVQAIDNVGNVSMTTYGEAFTVQSAGPEKPYVARGDRNGNGVSDVMFVWEQNNCAHGYWMDGKNDWWSANVIWVSPEWDNLGNYDMSGDGKADAVMFGNVIVNDARGAYIGYYQDGDDANGWVTIGYLDNSKNIAWQNKVGNLTGNANGANSIVWYAPELYALGVWTNGTDSWVDLSHEFGGKDWTLVGCGDFNGDGKDAVLMMYSGCMFYRADIDGNVASLGNAAWYNCEVWAIGDFSDDGKDDIVLFDKNTGGMYMLLDGNSDNYKSIGQLDPTDWFVAGCGDYNGDQKDDLLVRQYSTGMLGYYSNGNQANWNVMGYGVDMDWTVIA